jgi:ribosome production factor 1
MLITTSKRPSKFVYEFSSELIDVFPNSQFIKRESKFSIKQIIEFCTNRSYTDIMVVNEDKKVPCKHIYLRRINKETKLT